MQIFEIFRNYSSFCIELLGNVLNLLLYIGHSEYLVYLWNLVFITMKLGDVDRMLRSRKIQSI